MTPLAGLLWWHWVIALLALVAGLGVSPVLGLRRSLHRLSQVIRKVPRVFPTAPASDHWKQRAAIAYSERLLIHGVQASIALLPAVALPLTALRFLSGDWQRAFEAAAEPGFVVACIVTGCAWWWLRHGHPQR